MSNHCCGHLGSALLEISGTETDIAYTSRTCHLRLRHLGYVSANSCPPLFEGYSSGVKSPVLWPALCIGWACCRGQRKPTGMESQVLAIKSHLCIWKPAAAAAAVAAAAKSLQSCRTLCDPTDGSPPGSPVPGILQARTLEWVAVSFSKAWKWKVKVESLSHVWLLAITWTAAYQAPPSMGFSRQEYWSGVPLPCPMKISSICYTHPAYNHLSLLLPS